VHRMQALLDDLLDLEHIRSKIGFETQMLGLRDLLVNIHREMGPIFAAEKQTFSLDVPDKLPEVQVSFQWFERAVANYLSNANKYTQSGGKIVLRAWVKKDELLVEVEDNGPGIPIETQAHLFERFHRLPSAQPKKGSGLGLAIVKSVAEAHGGRVYASSKPGKGSVFGIAIPLPRKR
jgi:signal transduction histidine kinase